MNNSRESIYHNALQVTSKRIKDLSDDQLNDLMNYLLHAQAYKCGSSISELRVNTEIKASDDGCDGCTGKPAYEDEWLGTTDTCWQFKAGTASQPAQLSGEIIKDIPKNTLLNGGRYVLIASGSTRGLPGENDRRAALVEKANKSGIPSEKIDVFGSERLSNWCNQHPAIAAQIMGYPNGLWNINQWLNSKEHQVPWQASESMQKEITTQRSNLDFMKGEIWHLHIQGPPGVGKTRFVLELCRNADWRNDVIYVRDASDKRLDELIDNATVDKGARLLVIADEIQLNQLKPLREALDAGDGRIRLITIGNCSTPDPERIPALSIKPLEPKEMKMVIKGWYPGLPDEHIEFLTRFAEGYVRLAKLASAAVAKNPDMNIYDLLDRKDIQIFLNQMLGPVGQRSLLVVAVLTSVGWFGDKEEEGKIIAKELGLDWKNVKYEVENFQNEFSIVPCGGRYRYISPNPLGIYLAIEAWKIYPEQLRSLPDKLPSEKAREAYYQRLQSMASTPTTREFSREELSHFFRIDDFVNGNEVRRWSAFAAADPEIAAHNILHALINSNIEDRNCISGEARRLIVSTLVRIAWKSSSFYDATKCLALLAEAENESWANNATGEFLNRYQITLGGTATPYLERLHLIDDLIVENRPSVDKLLIQALSQIRNHSNFRMEMQPISDELPEKEWHPSSVEEELECSIESIKRLVVITYQNISDLQDELIKSAKIVSILLRNSHLRNFIEDFFIAIKAAYPQSREPLRRIIAEIIDNEKKYWKKLSPDELAEIEIFHSSFEDTSLKSRLLQFVGPSSWDFDEGPNLLPLATELYSDPNLLCENWPWLTSGEAQSVWLLGKALAEIDTTGNLAELMPSFPNRGNDLRLLCQYIGIKRSEYGDEWFDRWMDLQIKEDQEPDSFIIEITWRCGATNSIANKLAGMIRKDNITPQILGRLVYGNWSEKLSAEDLKNVLQAMIENGHEDTAIGILSNRLEKNTDETQFWNSLAIKLIVNPNLFRREFMINEMVSYHWKEITNTYIPDHAREIAAAILAEQIKSEKGFWFLDFSYAAEILDACSRQAPDEVWNEIKLLLSSPMAYRFDLGFPRGIVDKLPNEKIKQWIDEQPEEHIGRISRLINIDFSSDDNLASYIVEKYGDNEDIGYAMFSNYLPESWEGPISVMYLELAEKLEEISKTTALPKLHLWAMMAIKDLHRRAENDKQNEEEEKIRGW